MLECGRCGQSLPDESFTIDRSRESQRSIYCRSCSKAKRLEYGLVKPEGWARKTADMAAYQKAWRAAHQEKLKEYERRRPVREGEAERLRARYERKMRALHGDAWAPQRPRTDEERAAARAKRKKDTQRYRKAKRERDPAAMQAYKARRVIQRMLSHGTMVRWPCEVCGEKAEAHHPAYDRPRLVVWLCTTHHREAHAVTK